MPSAGVIYSLLFLIMQEDNFIIFLVYYDYDYDYEYE